MRSMLMMLLPSDPRLASSPLRLSIRLRRGSLPARLGGGDFLCSIVLIASFIRLLCLAGPLALTLVEKNSSATFLSSLSSVAVLL